MDSCRSPTENNPARAQLVYCQGVVKYDTGSGHFIRGPFVPGPSIITLGEHQYTCKSTKISWLTIKSIDNIPVGMMKLTLEHTGVSDRLSR